MKKVFICLVAIASFTAQSKSSTQQQIIKDLENYLQQRDYYNQTNVGNLITVCKNSRFSEAQCKYAIFKQLPHADFILDNCKKCHDSALYDLESCLVSCLNEIKRAEASTAPEVSPTKEVTVQDMKNAFSNKAFIETMLQACMRIDARLGVARTCFLSKWSPESRNFMTHNCGGCLSGSASISELRECMLACFNDLQQRLLYKTARAGDAASVKKLVEQNAHACTEEVLEDTSLHT